MYFSSVLFLQRRRVSAAIVTLGVMHTEGRRQAIDGALLCAAVFAGVDSLLATLVELVSAADGAVGVARTQSRTRQLTDALERLAAVGAITFSVTHISCLFGSQFSLPNGHTDTARIPGKRVREHGCGRQQASADK